MPIAARAPGPNGARSNHPNLFPRPAVQAGVRSRPARAGAAVIVLDRLGAADELLLFVLAAASLAPIAWLIGEATRQAAQHTGPGIGGLLNASFGNAPELITALFAVAHGLPEVVRASLAGSIVGNLLLVLGFMRIAAPPRKLDRTSAFASLGIVVLAASLMVAPAMPALGGDPVGFANSGAVVFVDESAEEVAAT